MICEINLLNVLIIFGLGLKVIIVKLIIVVFLLFFIVLKFIIKLNIKFFLLNYEFDL